MDFILDCETRDAALLSLSHGFRCTPEKVCEVLLLADLDLMRRQQDSDIIKPFDKWLYDFVVEMIGPHKKLASVNWFHGARTFSSNIYVEGVFPLGEALDALWEFLILNPPDDITQCNLEFMRKNGVSDVQYNLKVKNSIHWGPYGSLVRETLLAARLLHQHDYLELPEIVEDICNGYESQFGQNIKDYYSRCLLPKIVKFKSTSRLDNGCITAALCYVFNNVRGLKPDRNAITCFDGEGIAIEPSDILAVEQLTESSF